MDQTFLKEVPLFSNLNRSEMSVFLPVLKKLSAAKGEKIIEEGEQGDKLYLLFKGDVIITRRITMLPDSGDMHKTFTTLKGSDHTFFGEIGLLGFAQRTATVEAASECQLYTLSHHDFMKICETNPAVALKVTLKMAHQLSCLLQHNNEDILKLTTALIYALK